MTDEAMAEEYFKSVCKEYNEEKERTGERHYWVGFDLKYAYLAGLKAGRTQWYDLRKDPTDLPKGDEGYGKTSINRKIYLKDRDGNLYTGRYYPKDESHPEDCFAVEFLDWGLQGAQFCMKEQISEWCEVHV